MNARFALLTLAVGLVTGALAASPVRLILKTDAACQLTVDGRAQGALDPAKARELPLAPGEHTVVCTSGEGAQWTARETVRLQAGEPQDRVLRVRWAEAGEALLDRRHGLQWMRRDNGADVNQQEAMAWCAQQGAGWRLPQRAELEGLYASGAAGETTPCRGAQCKVPSTFTLSSYFQWSSQTEASSGQAWYVYLHTGHPTSSPADYRLNARALCVRQAN